MKGEGYYQRVIFPVALFFILIFGGAFIYTILEGWAYLDALYFSVATATTVGYGDFVPFTNGGKLFTIFFSFGTIGFAFYFFTLVERYFFTQRIKREILESSKLKDEKGTRPIKV